MAELPLLLDLDGTLVDTLPDICASANHLRRAFGLADVPPAVAAGWVGDGVFALMERALVELGPLEVRRDRAWEIYSEHHLEQCTVLARPYPGVAEHLGAWRRDGRPLGVVTNKPRRFTERILDHLGLTEFLPVLVCGDTLKVKKPDPEPLREALRRLDQPQGRGMMVGDSVQDLRAGRAAGLRTAAALFGFNAETTLRAEGADEYWAAFGVPAAEGSA